MSALYETTVTLEIDGVEEDRDVRAHVEMEPCRSRGWLATIDGALEVLVGEDWVDAGTLKIDPKSLERAEDGLCELALEDDSDYCGGY